MGSHARKETQMKKILIVLVALATATVVNAASVSWSINTTLNDVNFEAVEGTVAFYLTSAIGTNLSGSPLALSGGELSGTIVGDDQTSWTARITISNFAGESQSYSMDYVFDMDSITHAGTPDAATYLTALSAELSDAFTLGGGS